MMSERKRKHTPSDEKHHKLLQSKEEGQNASTGLEKASKTIEGLENEVAATENETEGALSRPRSKKRKRSPSDEEHAGVVLDNLGTKLQQSEEERHHVSISFKEANKTIERLKKELDATKNAKDGSLTSLQEANKTIERLEKELDATMNAKDGSLTSLEEAKKTIERLEKELDATETEKDNALTRLSAMMSVKLRDNNPNIADLSDPNRPTKLAEMFSELYDNEWTDTFTVLNVKFTERQSISILLEIVMEAYEFCTDVLDRTWKVVSAWYINDALPNAQQLAKNLKDSRKTLVSRVTHDETQKFIEKLHSTCGIQLKELLSSEKVVDYISKSVKLCLLMCASDPPVVIECQETHRDKTTLSGEDANNDKKQHEEYVCGSKGSGKEKEEEITHHSDAGSGRSKFNKDKFKEYTSRGPYLEYIVWPVMYLHQGGPMLGKGVAQGTREAVEGGEEEQWTWKQTE